VLPIWEPPTNSNLYRRYADKLLFVSKLQRPERLRYNISPKRARFCFYSVCFHLDPALYCGDLSTTFGCSRSWTLKACREDIRLGGWVQEGRAVVCHPTQLSEIFAIVTSPLAITEDAILCDLYLESKEEATIIASVARRTAETPGKTRFGESSEPFVTWSAYAAFGVWMRGRPCLCGVERWYVLSEFCPPSQLR
jgi:hypothetical protein